MFLAFTAKLNMFVNSTAVWSIFVCRHSRKLINKYDTTNNDAVKPGDYTGVPQGRLLWLSLIVVDDYHL